MTLGRDLDGDGDPDEIDIHLEVDEIQEEIYPGQFETFWVFAPEGKGMCSPARLPSPTIRVEVGDHVRIHLHNTHYLPHTIHLHGTIHPNAMDGVPEFTQAPVMPGQTFTYEFVAQASPARSGITATCNPTSTCSWASPGCSSSNPTARATSSDT